MENNESSLESIVDTMETVVTGIPAPLRKNFFKAFGQLCTAAVDIPVALLEGKSSEIRALTEARIKIIKKEGDTISDKVEVPKEYVAKASSKYASKIIKEQINLDDITLNAAQDLRSKEVKGDSEPQQEIADDWLNEFESHARLKSSEEMKLIFGKILSSEVSSPGSFSIRTIRQIAQLDNQAAKLFQLLCSQSIAMNFGAGIYDARVVSFNGNAASNSLSQFGLSFDNLNVLQEYGLIISDYNSYMGYGPCIAHDGSRVSASLLFNNKAYGLIPTDEEAYDKSLSLHGVALTKSGKELLSIIPINNSSAYEAALIEYFQSKHLRMVELDK